MVTQSIAAQARSAHVVVFGNEKGGAGKSTAAMHVTIALMKAGWRVATIDLDGRQQSFTRYIENRRALARKKGLPLEMPTHFCVARGRADQPGDEGTGFDAFVGAVGTVERSHDFIIVDTPSADIYLMRLAHAAADTLITPLVDSLMDLDVIGTVDPDTAALASIGCYGEIVREARRQRRLIDGGCIDWVVVRNRLSAMEPHDARLIGRALADLAPLLDFHGGEGIPERLVFREFFTRGLTALDDLDPTTLGTRPSMSHVTARHEITQFLRTLRLPTDMRRRGWAAARAEPAPSVDRPLQVQESRTD